LNREALVVDSIVETADTRTLVLDVGPVGTYRAGQYVSIDPHQFIGLRSFIGYLEHLKGRREAPRAYSMCSAPHEKYLAITIKEEVYKEGETPYPPLVSGYLVHQVRPGDRIVVSGYAGAYVLPENVEERVPHVLHVVAGSGSVPDLAMVKDSLVRHTRLRHTFLYSNKTWDDVIFRDELGRLAAEHPARLRVIHTLTRESEETCKACGALQGRIGLEVLAGVLEREPESLVYICGTGITVYERRAHAAKGTTPPPRFIETVKAHLGTLGFPPERIKLESYG
jgi:ferredoxin-NADP reductase